VTDPRADILSVTDVAKRFGGLRAVDGTTLTVARGSITALIGPNGAGKTTLFNLLTGFERPDRGAVELDGRVITGAPPHAVARRGMLRTFQLTKALEAMTVLENLLLGATHQPGEHLLGLLRRPRGWRVRETEIHERAHALLERMGLTGKAGDYAGTLSGGQRKLLELARLLMADPRLVLLDEPLAGVNPVLGERLLEHMHELREANGTTFLFIEHDMEAVMRNAERVIVMAQGRVISSGAPTEVRNDQRVIDAYLGAHAGTVIA
jgi:branched-chain amino acid transport system ATP-binding protein